MEKTAQNVDNTYTSSCRICLAKNRQLKLMKNRYYDSIPYFNLYYECMGQTLKQSTSIPMIICNICERQLINFYEFKKMCLQTEQIIEKYLMELCKNGQESNNSISVNENLLDTNNFDTDVMIQSENFLSVFVDEEREETESISETFDFTTNVESIGEEKDRNIDSDDSTSNQTSSFGSNELQGRENTILKPYKCSVCEKAFRIKFQLTAHSKQHTNEKRYECPHCQEKFISYLKKRLHINKIHLKQNIYQCPFCPESYLYNERYHRHINREHGKAQDFKCEICPRKFYTENELNSHHISHTPILECKSCNKVYKTMDSYGLHMRKYHKSVSNRDKLVDDNQAKDTGLEDNLNIKYKTLTIEPDFSVETEDEDVSDKLIKLNNSNTYKCEKCRKYFKSRYNLENHTKIVHSKRVCIYCGKMINQTQFYHHVKRHENKAENKLQFNCKDCDKSYTTDYGLYAHRKAIHLDKKYTCKNCDKEFKFYNTRRLHIHKVHLNKPIYTCPYCGKGFFYNISYKGHIRREHPMGSSIESKNYSCEQCSKMFVSATALKNHKITHSEDRNFKCEFCEKFFKTLRAVKSHIRTHTGEKNYVCPVCPKAYAAGHDLKKHLKTHPSYRTPKPGTVLFRRN